MAKSQTVILSSMTIAVVAALTTNIASKSETKGSPVRIVIGGYLVTVGLLLGSEVNEKVAEGFAILILTASLFGPNGDVFANLITRTVGGTPTAPPANPSYGYVYKQ